MNELLYYLDIFGIIVFALSGALMAGRYKLDPFGVVVLASVTAIGGGTIRDTILQTPVFWVVEPYYLYVILVTALLTIVLIRRPKRIPKRFLLIADALGLALFAVLGTQKSMALGSPLPVAIVMGTITGVAGGMIRDVLCNVIPMILRQEIYALAAMLGGSLFILLHWLNWSDTHAIIVAICAALILRLAAIYWHVSLPAFNIVEKHFEEDCDVVYFSPTSVYDSGKPSLRHTKYSELVMSYLDNKDDTIRFEFFVPWSKLYKSEFLRNHDIKFDEVIASNDVTFSLMSGFYGENFKVSQETIYCVVESSNSLTTNMSEDVVDSRFDVLCRYNEFVKEKLSSKRQVSVISCISRARKIGIFKMLSVLFYSLHRGYPIFPNANGWKRWFKRFISH